MTHGAPIWHRGHFNQLAKEIREVYPPDLTVSGDIERNILETLAVNLCHRFTEERIGFEDKVAPFEPITFLKACSPDNEKYPIYELWRED